MVDTALGRLGVQTRGSGEAIMFWPSLLMTGDMWAAQADYFGDRRRVILVDPPGHGRLQRADHRRRGGHRIQRVLRC